MGWVVILNQYMLLQMHILLSVQALKLKMAFYLESEFLDKKNIYQNFSYESLEDKSIIASDKI